MKEIKVNELTDNLFETISKEWMLVTAGTKDKFNTMTANWGGAGFLWNRPVAFIFIRPERYTFDFIEQNDYLTLSFLGEEHKEVHKICGSKSGRDMDKVKATGLSPLFTENGSITFEQARLTFECKKLYADLIKPGNFIDKSITDRWYGESHGGFHKMYVVEIVNPNLSAHALPQSLPLISLLTLLIPVLPSSILPERSEKIPRLCRKYCGK